MYKISRTNELCKFIKNIFCRAEADPSLMVKEYTRPAAGRHDPTPSDLRSAHALVKTTNFLIER